MIKQKHLFVITVYLLTLVSCGQKIKTNNEHSQKDGILSVKNLNIAVFEFAIPPHDKDGMFPVTRVEIKKDSFRPTFLKFQPGGTETNIFVVDSVYSSNYKDLWDTPPIKRLDFGHSESGLLDISDLNMGTYFVRYMSCNITGAYTLTLTN